VHVDMDVIAVKMSSSTANSHDKKSERSLALRTDMSLVCLNFKVPLRVRQQFKIYAARHNMTMSELLLRLLEESLASAVNRGYD
jgi:hypothetical protein